MNRAAELKPVFVEFVPELLAEGELYISVQYATAMHKCCCGCGTQVVTPLSPIDWRMIFDGATVSLEPSIGNWSFPCRSHYWITNNRVRWAAQWSQAQISAGREFDRASKVEQYDDAAPPMRPELVVNGSGIWARVKARLARFVSRG